MTRLSSLKRSISLAALALMLAAPAFAQQAAGPVERDVVIISAQQREEDLQDVPLSATALSGDALEALFSGGEDVLALATRVPGVYAESSNGRVAPRFYIRGLGNTDFDLAASQPVSLIYDDVVLENVVLKSTPLFDLQQVEVYRGPQGTLFGRNTTAGVIRFQSVKPGSEYTSDFSASYGTFGSSTVDGGVTIPIVEGLSLRASGLWQHRDDWIDNTRQPGEENLGGFDERAGRVQVLWSPTDRLDVLLNYHARRLDGTAAVFRANAVSVGSNELSASYDRDKVSFNQGGGNLQEYEGRGYSAKVDYDFGGAKLTSITAYETTEGYSRGDIDGGVAGVGPGFIPFDSDTKDSIDDLGQTTQEFRLASTGDGALTWTGGFYYFNAHAQITTVGPFGFPPSTTVKHTNNSWAWFGQMGYQFTDQLSMTAGVRYTQDKKDFTARNNAAATRVIEDDHVSWEVSGMYDVTPAFSVYARVADGFRGPSIQGRDVAFFSPPSVANSETILSGEVGWKSYFADSGLTLNGAAYMYEVSDLQLTAVGGAGNTVQLLNADTGKAYGFEVDASYEPVDNLVISGGLSYTHTEIEDANLAVGVCAQCTVTNRTVTLSGTRRALIDGNPFPNAPEFIANISARYSMPIGDGGELFGSTDWAWQGDTNILLYEAAEFRTDGQFEGGLKLGYARTDGSFEIALFGRNITDEDNIKGAIDFNNNTVFVNDPRIIGISLSFHK